MRNSFSKKQIGLAVACALALGLMSGAARAQRAQSASGWLQDSQGNVVHNGTGLCVHGGSPATPNPNSTLECDPNFKPVAAYVAPAPQPVAVAPAPLVVQKVAQKFTFDADAMFDVDKSALRPAGRTTLDNFVYRIKGINPEAIMVVGHASRPGTEQHNQKLSEERAESVKTYLVSSGIAPYRVQTSGKGETQPITLVGECASDSNMSAKAAACRQPDRRVEIELIGARIPE